MHDGIERITALTTTDLNQIYEQQIKSLPRAIRLQLLARIAQDLAAPDPTDEPEHSLLELEGLGAEIWHGIDAQHSMSMSCATSGIGRDEARRRADGSRSPRLRYRTFYLP